VKARVEPQRVVVTGGAGFIGHHLVQAIADDGREVLVIDDLSTGRADRLPGSVRLEQLDLAIADAGPLLRAWRPRLVFHLAAQASVSASEANPERDLLVNGLATLRLAQASARAGVARFVFVSSGGAVYGETAEPATERTPVAPVSVYGAHKVLGELYVARSGLDHAIARPSNVYGPGQTGGLEGAVVAAFVDAARTGAPLVIHGDGTQTRDFIEVSDVVAALIRLGSVSESGVWNVSRGSSTSIADLAAVMERIADRQLPRATGQRRAGDAERSEIASDRLRVLGWEPLVSLEQGVRALLRGR